MSEFDDIFNAMKGRGSVTVSLPPARPASPAGERKAKELRAKKASTKNNEDYWRKKLSNQGELKAAPPRSTWRRFMDNVEEGMRMGPANAIAIELGSLVETGDGSTRAERRRRMAEREKQRRADVAAVDPADSVGDYISDFAGQIVGAGISDPTTFVGGIGGRNVGEKLIDAAGISALADAGLQGVDIAQGVSDEYDPIRGAINVAAPPAIYGAVKGVQKTGQAIRRGMERTRPIDVPDEGGAGSTGGPVRPMDPRDIAEAMGDPEMKAALNKAADEGYSLIGQPSGKFDSLNDEELLGYIERMADHFENGGTHPDLKGDDYDFVLEKFDAIMDEIDFRNWKRDPANAEEIARREKITDDWEKAQKGENVEQFPIIPRNEAVTGRDPMAPFDEKLNKADADLKAGKITQEEYMKISDEWDEAYRRMNRIGEGTDNPNVKSFSRAKADKEYNDILERRKFFKAKDEEHFRRVEGAYWDARNILDQIEANRPPITLAEWRQMAEEIGANPRQTLKDMEEYGSPEKVLDVQRDLIEVWDKIEKGLEEFHLGNQTGVRPGGPVDNTGYEKFTPYVEPKTPANDPRATEAKQTVPQKILKLLKDLWKDESGTVRVFHGTTKEIKGPLKTTDYDGMLGKGFYVTTDPKYASIYADTIPMERWRHVGGNVLPFNVDETKIFGFDKIEKGWTFNEIMNAADELGFGGDGFRSDVLSIVNDLKKVGAIDDNETRLPSEMAIWAMQHFVGKARLRDLVEAKGYTGIAAKMRDEVEINIFDPNEHLEDTFGTKLKKKAKELLDDESGAFRPFGRRGYRDDGPSRPEGREESPGREKASEVEKKFIDVLKDAKKTGRKQEKLYHEERAKRAAHVASVQEKGGPFWEQVREQSGALKGEYPKAEYESIVDKFAPEDVDALATKINESQVLLPFQKTRALLALAKLLGVDGAKIPQPNEIKLLGEVFSKPFVKAILKKRDFREKFWDNVGHAANFPRAVIASMDFSAPFRQGLFLVTRKEFWKAWGTMFKAFGSQRVYDAVNASIKSHPNSDLMRRAGLHITDMGEFMSQREEDFMSKWAGNLPGVKHSNRAFTAFLNKVRSDVFNNLISKGHSKGKVWDDKALKSLGHYINAATGRGHLAGVLERGAPLLNALFFSPRLISSRLTLLNPVTYVTMDPFVRKQALRDLVGLSATAATLLSLAKMAGAEVETDSKSSDFAKIKIGNHRYDILGGFQQYYVLGSRLVEGEVTTSKGTPRPLDGKGLNDSRATLSAKFFRNKFSPTISYFWTALHGTNPIGEEFDAKKDTLKLFIPLLAQDLYDIYKDEGLEDVPKGLPAAFGVGIQTYDENAPKEKDEGDEWDKLFKAPESKPSANSPEAWLRGE